MTEFRWKNSSRNPSRPGVLDKIKMAELLEKGSLDERASPETRASAARIADILRKIHTYRYQDN